jgi:hypothetical protein
LLLKGAFIAGSSKRRKEARFRRRDEWRQQSPKFNANSGSRALLMAYAHHDVWFVQRRTI